MSDQSSPELKNQSESLKLLNAIEEEREVFTID